MRRSRLSVPLLAVVAVGTLGLTACGSSSSSGSATTVASGGATTVAPEDVKVDAATVTAGLTKLPATIAAAITAIGTPDADAKLAEIENEWRSFEGTVRSTDQTIYLAIEDQLSPLQQQIGDGDSATATTTATKLSELFTQYLAAHPG